MPRAKKSDAQTVQEPTEVPVQPQVAQAQPESPQAQPAAQMPQSKSNKGVLVAVGLVVLIIAGVAGYGYWNGQQVKTYAQKAEGYINTAKGWDDDFNMTSIADEKDQVTDFTKAVKDIKAESEKILAELNSKKAPAKAQALEGYLKEYFGITKQLAVDLESVGVYFESMMKMSESMSSLSTLGSSPEDAEKIKKELQDVVDDLKKITPPDSMKVTHDKLITTLEKVIDAFDDMVDAINAGDYERLMQISSDFYDIENDFDFGGDVTDMFKDYEDDADKIDELESKIANEVKTLKNVTFTF